MDSETLESTASTSADKNEIKKDGPAQPESKAPGAPPLSSTSRIQMALARAQKPASPASETTATTATPPPAAKPSSTAAFDWSARRLKKLEVTAAPGAPAADAKAETQAVTPPPQPAAIPHVIHRQIVPRAESPAAPQTEPKVEAKTEVRVSEQRPPEPKIPEFKPEARPETKAESRQETRVEPRPEAKAELKQEAKAEPKQQSKPEPKLETKAEPKPETKPEPKQEAKAETKPGVKAPEPKPEPKVEAKPAAKIPEVKAEPKPEPKPEPKKEPQQEAKVDPKPQQDKESKKDRKNEPQKPAAQTAPPPPAKTEPKESPSKPAAGAISGAPALDAPSLATFGPKGGLPGIVKIGIALGLVVAIGGGVWFKMKTDPSAVSSQGPAKKRLAKPYKTGPSLMVNTPGGWNPDWGGDINHRKGRTISFYRPSAHLDDYRIEFEGQIGAKGLGWIVRAVDPSNYYAYRVEFVKTGQDQISLLSRSAMIDGDETAKHYTPLVKPVRPAGPFRVRVDVRGDEFTVYINDDLIEVWNDSRLARGGVGSMTESGDNSQIRKLQIFDFLP